jgi:hypothetical protein
MRVDTPTTSISWYFILYVGGLPGLGNHPGLAVKW